MGTKDVEYVYKSNEQLHLGCPNVKKGKMIFLKSTARGDKWHCSGCNTEVTTHLFPSYKEYKERDKKWREILDRTGTT